MGFMDIKKSANENSENQLRRTAEAVLFGFYYGLPFILVSVLIHLNPSGFPPSTPFSSLSEALITGISFFLPAAAGSAFLFNHQNKRFFVPFFFILMFVFLSATVFAAVIIHRDYVSILFQIIMNHIIIAVLKARFFGNRHRTRSFSQPFMIAVLIMLVLFSFWVILMGWTIAVRADPRWIESIFCNLYNCIIIFFLFLSILHLRGSLYKKMEIGRDRLFVDGYDITRLINTTNLLILYSMISQDREVVTCSVLDPLVFSSNRDGESSVKKWTCDECLANSYKATQCPRYKTIYNGILELKKTLETFELGTILPPENRKNILTEGWKILFFEGVRVRIKY